MHQALWCLFQVSSVPRVRCRTNASSHFLIPSDVWQSPPCHAHHTYLASTTRLTNWFCTSVMAIGTMSQFLRTCFCEMPCLVGVLHSAVIALDKITGCPLSMRLLPLLASPLTDNLAEATRQVDATTMSFTALGRQAGSARKCASIGFCIGF